MASRHRYLAFLLHRLGNPLAFTGDTKLTPWGFNTAIPVANPIPSLCAYQEPKLFRLSHTSEPEVLNEVYHSLLGVSPVRSLSPTSTRLVALPLPWVEEDVSCSQLDQGWQLAL